jgi:hypothetical protein
MEVMMAAKKRSTVLQKSPVQVKMLPELYMEDGSRITPCKPMFSKKEAAEQLVMLQRFNKFYVTALEFVQLSMAEQCTLGPQERAKYQEMANEGHEIWEWIESLDGIHAWAIFFDYIEDARQHQSERQRKFGSGEEVAHG